MKVPARARARLAEAMDTFTKEKRSEVMGRIRSSNTKAEIAVRSLLHRAGFRFRLHGRKLPGKPDLVLAKYKAAVFVHGCFWHGHSCKDGRRPKSNTGYWNAKLDRNLARDIRNADELRRMGWKTVVVWACELEDKAALLDRLRSELTDDAVAS